MAPLLQSSVRNKLLSGLTPVDFERLSPYLEPVELPRHFALSAPDQISDHSYFLESGIGSIVAALSTGQEAEIGIFGREGMAPTALVMHAQSAPYSIFMQVGGMGFRIQSIRLSSALEDSFALRSLLLRFAQVMAVQASFTALSNATHHIEERLARWILMCHDRSEGDTIALTHEFLSIMLAVRRQSVTTALHVLEGQHLIVASRSRVMVRDREALEQFAGAAYGPPEKEYRRLIGHF